MAYFVVNNNAENLTRSPDSHVTTNILTKGMKAFKAYHKFLNYKSLQAKSISISVIENDFSFKVFKPTGLSFFV